MFGEVAQGPLHRESVQHPEHPSPLTSASEGDCCIEVLSAVHLLALERSLAAK